eukprot:m.666637 g.666637  ORF g.666637 m.666637 type:complete len:50 (+) comp22751_c0_seq2:1759-1908(+)
MDTRCQDTGTGELVWGGKTSSPLVLHENEVEMHSDQSRHTTTMIVLTRE